MSAPSSVAARLEAGRQQRQKIKRKALAQTKTVRRDPVDLLKQFDAERLARLMPLRYGRMQASPFAFYRGSAMIQAHDLAQAPHTEFIHQICGDAHLMNFGSFATPERNQIFDLNDFDETYPGPWEWDVKRLVVSLELAARHRGFKANVAEAAVCKAAGIYQQAMREYAQMGALTLWAERISAETTEDKGVQDILVQLAQKGLQRTQDSTLLEIGVQKNGAWRFQDRAPAYFHLEQQGKALGFDEASFQLKKTGSGFWRFMNAYLKTLSPSHQQLLSYFTPRDVVFRIAGIGSVGARGWVVLMLDKQGQPLFLQVKQAISPALQIYGPRKRKPYPHQGKRVVVGQRFMQSASDQLLGWATDSHRYPYYFRQLRDRKVAIDLETLDIRQFESYASLCAKSLARAHARAGGLAAEIAGYIGESDAFCEAMMHYATAYAEQVEADFAFFQKACRSGHLPVQTDAEFRAAIPI